MSRMQRLQWFRLATNVPKSRHGQHSRAAFARTLRVEPLEDRRMLAIVVDTLVDEVDGSIIDGDISLRDAITVATPGEVISFDGDLFSGGPATLNLSLMHGEVVINKSLTISGPGADLLTIDASGLDLAPAEFSGGGRVFNISDNISGNFLDVTIEGVTLTGADKYEEGGAIRSLENLTLIDSVVTGNQSSRGGGLYNGSGTIEIIRSTITANNNNGPQFGHFGSGITNWLGTLIVTDSTISDNGFTVCEICGSFKGGAGIVNHHGSTTVTGSAITGNSGGGIYSTGLDAAADLTISETTISGNVNGFLGGEGLRLSNTVSDIQNSFINDNERRGIYSRFGDLTIAGSTISGNTGSEGAGIRNVAADLTISETTISGNTATGDGGGIYHGEGNLSITSSTISGNTAGGSGGGLRLRTSPYDADTMLISNSTISGNTADVWGGGIWARTFTGNTFDLVHSTVTDNTADADSIFGGEGGGMFFFYSTGIDTIDHTIVAGNVRGNGGRDDIDGDVEATFSLVGDNTGATITDNGGNLIGSGGVPIDPRLAPLADNGGPTQTHRLQVGSPALDMGDEDAVANMGGVPEFDQRGNPFTRVFDGDGDAIDRIDIGAYESDTVFFTVDTLDDESDGDYSLGDFSLREALELSNASATVETIGFDSSLDGETITLSLGELSITAAMIIETVGLANGLTVDASGNDFTPATIDGLGSRVFVVDDGDSGIPIDVTISGLTLTGADNANSGGAIYSDELLTLINSLLTGNAAQWGGGIYNGQYGDLTVIGSTISGNTATSSGGGVYNWGGTASIEESSISVNYAPEGAGIHNVNDGFLSLLRSTVSGNNAAIVGGGILNHGVQVTVAESTISGNNAGSGAGIMNASGEMIVRSSTISGNIASGSGGGIFNDFGPLSVSDSTISGNAAGYGGGLYIGGDIGNVTTITNSTISNNVVSLGGGGVYNFQGFVNIEFSTITENEAPADQGSGLYSWADALTATTNVYSSIIAGNVNSDVDDDPFGVSSYVTNGYNLVGTGVATGAFNGTGDTTGIADPLLGPLANNGGPTFTHALLPGSPAINAGEPGLVPGGLDVPLYDQRGVSFSRVMNGQIDVGAFELQTPLVLPGDYNGDGVVTGRDFLAWQRGESPDPFSAEDLEAWQEEYGGGGLSAIGSQLLAGESPESSDESLELEFGSGLLTVGTSLEPETASVVVSDEVSFEVAMDRALEELAAVPRYGVSGFGEMMARRGVKKIRNAEFGLWN